MKPSKRRGKKKQKFGPSLSLVPLKSLIFFLDIFETDCDQLQYLRVYTYVNLNSK